MNKFRGQLIGDADGTVLLIINIDSFALALTTDQRQQIVPWLNNVTIVTVTGREVDSDSPVYSHQIIVESIEANKVITGVVAEHDPSAKENVSMAVDQAKFLAALNSPDIIQRWRLRAILKGSGTDPDMTGPLFRQFIAVGAATNATEATALSTGCPVTMQAKATAVANGLVANEGLPVTATTGPIITEILALIQQFLPMLISCIPAIA